jgi:hypothetical protein
VLGRCGDSLSRFGPCSSEMSDAKELPSSSLFSKLGRADTEDDKIPVSHPAAASTATLLWQTTSSKLDVRQYGGANYRVERL